MRRIRLRRGPGAAAGAQLEEGAYSAFISYSHAVDGKLAPALRSGLQRFAKPWYRLRSLRVFLDESSLSVTPELWPSIVRALDSSAFLILLASPMSARSRWVSEEVDHWCSSKSERQVLVALTDGELVWDDDRSDFDWARTDALPATLRGRFADEPRWVDLRWAHSSDDLSLRQAQFRDAVAELAATLHGVPKDVLAGEDVRQHRRTVRVARAVVATLVCLTLATAVFAVVAYRERGQAIRQLHASQSRQLAAVAVNTLDGEPARALLLAIESEHLSDTPEARSALLAGVGRMSEIDRLLPAVSAANEAAYQPDGRALAVSYQGGTVRLWNLGKADAKPAFTLRTTTSSSIGPIAFNRDGTLFATGSLDGLVRVWQTSAGASGRPTSFQVAGSGGASVHSVALYGDRLLAVGTDARGLNSSGGVVTVWDVTKPGKPLARFTSAAVTNSVAFDSDGKLAAGFADGSVTVWDFANGSSDKAVTTTLRGTTDSSIVSLAFSPRGSLLAAGRDDGVVTIWDVAERGGGRREIHDFGPADAVFSPDGRKLATATGQGHAVLWDLGTTDAEPSVIRRIDAGTPLGDIAFAPDGTHVALVSVRGTTFLWDVGRPGTLPGSSAIHDIAISADGAKMAAADVGGSVRLWNMRRLGRPPQVFVTGAGVNAVAFSRDGATLAAGTRNGVVRFWSTTEPNGGITRFLPGTATSTITSLAYQPGGNLFATGSGDGKVRLWPLRGRAFGQPHVLDIGAQVFALAFSPDGSRLAVGTGEGSVKVFDLDNLSSAPVRIHGGSNAVIYSVAFSPDGKTLAAAMAEGIVNVWASDGGSSQPSDVLRATSIARDVAFSPDGMTIAAASGYLYSWYGDAHTPFGRLAPPDKPGSSTLQNYGTLAFTPDGRTLVAAGDGGEISFWSPLATADDTASQTARLCGIVRANLAKTDWERLLPGVGYRPTCPEWTALIR